jgi:hypothetical protein
MCPRRRAPENDEQLTASLLGFWRDELGLSVTRELGAPRETDRDEFDEVISLHLDDRVWRLYIDWKSRAPSAFDLQQLEARAIRISNVDTSGVLCLAVPRLLKRHRAALRESGISHADLRSILYLRAPGLLIDIDRLRDSTDRAAAAMDAPAASPADPFSDRTSLVARTLLEYPRESFKVIDLAKLTGISAGWVSRVANELCHRGYAVRSARELQLADAVSLLQDWARVYTWRRNPVQRFEVPYSAEEILRKLRLHQAEKPGSESGQAALTLHSAAQLVSPHVRSDVVALYAQPPVHKRLLEWLARDLQAQPTTAGGGFQLVTPFYERSAFYQVKSISGLPIVSLPQLFLDLVHYPVRGQEAASMLVRTALGDHLRLQPVERQRLLRELEQ